MSSTRRPRSAPEGLFISLKDQGNIKAVLENWREKGVKVAVVTDVRVPAAVAFAILLADRRCLRVQGSRILGLGDLGLGGIGISCGKLALYVAAGGVKPEETLPIGASCARRPFVPARSAADPCIIRRAQSLTWAPTTRSCLPTRCTLACARFVRRSSCASPATTDGDCSPALLSSQTLQKRRPLSDNIAFLDEFMVAFREVFPSALVQFEDFSSEAAFLYLDRYQGEYCMFNDDVQGTGSVILGGFINAAVKSAEASGRALGDQKIGACRLLCLSAADERPADAFALPTVFLGAGSAAVGVAKQLISFFTRNGVSEAEAVKRFWLVDTKGLVTADRGDKLAEHKKFFQRFDNDGQQFKTLKEVVDYVQRAPFVSPTTSRSLALTYCAPQPPRSSASARREARLTRPRSARWPSSIPECVHLRLARPFRADSEFRAHPPQPIVFPLSNPLTKCELTFEDALSWCVVSPCLVPRPLALTCRLAALPGRTARSSSRRARRSRRRPLAASSTKLGRETTCALPLLFHPPPRLLAADACSVLTSRHPGTSSPGSASARACRARPRSRTA